MNKRTLLSLGTVGLVAALNPLQAEIQLTDKFFVEGYGGVSARGNTPDPGEGASTLDIDAARLLTTAKLDKVTAKLGAFYDGSNLYGGGADNFTLLDATAAYDFGNGLSATAGNYLSYLGYEAFHLPGMTTLTYGSGKFLAAIPGYRTGAKVDYTTQAFSLGASITDSELSEVNALRGDGELDEDFGAELVATFTGVEKLTIFAGLGYEYSDTTVVIGNLWAAYDLGMFVPAAEIQIKDTEDSDAGTGYNALANLLWKITDEFSATFRLGYEDMDDNRSFAKGTIAPAYALTANLAIRAEYSRTEYDDVTVANNGTALDSEDFLGVQVLFTF